MHVAEARCKFCDRASTPGFAFSRKRAGVFEAGLARRSSVKSCGIQKDTRHHQTKALPCGTVPPAEARTASATSSKRSGCWCIRWTIVLETLQSRRVKDVVDEPILQQMDKEELIYAIYEVLHALLNSNPVPNDGHPGYQEAIIAELLNQTHTDVTQELKDSQLGSHARMAAWHSYERLCATIDPAGNKSFDLFPDLELDLANPKSLRIARNYRRDVAGYPDW